jgi:hypothetical protein
MSCEDSNMYKNRLIEKVIAKELKNIGGLIIVGPK